MKNDFLTLIKTRRSIRAYKPESSVCHVVFYLSKHSLWFYTPPASMLDTFF